MAMKKNVAGQKVGVQMTTIADGSPFTGSVTVYVTGDAGTQAAGSVGSGACTHEGKGYHTYAPAQAETNYDLVAFTFEGTGAATVTVHERPDTLAADIDTLAADIAAIKAKTDNLPADPADDSDIDAQLATIAGYLDTEIAAIKGVTDKLDDTLEDDGGTYRFTANALEEGPGGGSAPTAAEVADAVWDEATADHVTAGTFGKRVADVPTAGANADAVWDEAVSGHVSAGTFGARVQRAITVPQSGGTYHLPFFMGQLASPGTPALGLTVTAERCLDDAGAFEAMENAPVEVGEGWYTVELDDADRAGEFAIYKFTAAAAKPTGVVVRLEPVP